MIADHRQQDFGKGAVLTRLSRTGRDGGRPRVFWRAGEDCGRGPTRCVWSAPRRRDRHCPFSHQTTRVQKGAQGGAACPSKGRYRASWTLCGCSRTRGRPSSDIHKTFGHDSISTTFLACRLQPRKSLDNWPIHAGTPEDGLKILQAKQMNGIERRARSCCRRSLGMGVKQKRRWGSCFVV